eukprot:CAMPEP_0206443104 /NCGR_PEP_ID=MMETSP0324_2-20121206/14186_1 /ASSEMBLY_ACC=CAM_ASM_000836 /TAXON_ID=2866 /ORGANISM="Crypthecodinium cohnii, Strain Seligo" /LENGTH=261 /DNA_ID=CAMNT_0053911009 /DNA_START=145 /DNA_END=930 /DNA_ORIENTATION=-
MFENDQETLMQEAWSVYSPPSRGGIIGDLPGEQVLVLMRLLGVVPEAEEANNIKGEMHRYEDFQKLMHGRMKDAENTDDLERGFNVFDRDGKGSIHQNHFRAMMGDLLSAGEMETILQQADIDADGHLDYVLLSEMLMKKPDGSEGGAPAPKAAATAPTAEAGGERGGEEAAAAAAAAGDAPTTAALGGGEAGGGGGGEAASGEAPAAPAAAPAEGGAAAPTEAAPAAPAEVEEAPVAKVKSGKRATVVTPAEEESQKMAP